MTGLPQGWAMAELPDVAFFQEGPGLRKFQYREEGIPFLNIRTFVDGRVDKSLCRFLDRSEVETKYRHFLVESGDILVATSGSIGKLAIAHAEDLPLMLNTSIVRFRPLDKRGLNEGYLLWYLRSPVFTDQAWSASTGSAQANVGPTHLKSFQIPLPPLPEQRRIVRRLDTLSARSTTARTHLTAIEKLVERYKLAVLSGSLFRNGTPVKRLGEVLTDIRYGTAAKCSYDPSGTPVLRIPNIQSGRIDRTDLKSAHFATKEIEQLALKAGDILVIRSNGSPDLVGRVALVTDGETDCLFAGYLIRLRLSATEALPEYVRLCFESDEVRAIIEAASKSTSGVNNVNSTQLKEIALPMPTVDEQREIVRRIETAFGKIDRLAAEAAKALKLLGHLDQRILAKAFAGDLVPQDPTDEPAETLLARIRETRAAAPKSRRGRK